MELINQSFDIWGQTPANMKESIEWIEKAGRICWDSKPAGDSVDFFQRVVLVKNHGSVAEHSNMVFHLRDVSTDRLQEVAGIFANSSYITVSKHNGIIYIAGNLRAWIEWMQLTVQLDTKTLMIFKLPALVANTINFNLYNTLHSLLSRSITYHIDHSEDIPKNLRRYTVKIVTDRAVLAEITRHRNDTAFSVRSQRFCDESNLTIIHPEWIHSCNPKALYNFYIAMNSIEQTYQELRQDGLRKEQARVVLPNQTATTLAMTAYKPQWINIFKLRTAPTAYPPIRNLITGIQKELTSIQGW